MMLSKVEELESVEESSVWLVPHNGHGYDLKQSSIPVSQSQ